MERRTKISLTLAALYVALTACVAVGSSTVDRHRWWSGLGPVLPHDDFPADCSMCHEGSGWNDLVDDFEFDHGAETGVELSGAHTAASCIRCHNDRGPVASFAARGCAGCHEDVHLGTLGPNCTDCHGETNWRPTDQLAMHRRTRFPLIGAHASTSCRRCHEGAQVGRFSNAPLDCLSCHQADLQAATVPDHFALGYTNRCDRCHVPTTWNRAEVDPNF